MTKPTTKRAIVEAPDLPVSPNATAFLRGGSVANHRPPAEERPWVVTIRLPRAWKQDIEHKLVAADTSLQEIGLAAYETFLKR